MRTTPKVLLLVLALIISAVTPTVLSVPSAQALPLPSFRVVCIPQKMARIDPIVFAGQTNTPHMHTFFGARNVTPNASLASLSKGPSSACGSNFGIDKSAYWVPTLYKNGKPIYHTDERVQLAVYYRRAGGPSGAKVRQAFPRGLRMVAGDMMATKPQSDVDYECRLTNDSGTITRTSRSFPSCHSNETLVITLLFPDCWDGKHLDATDHKSHMAYSRGPRATCPASHPVKLAQITYEVWYHGVNGPAKDFRLASGGAYSMHGDLISAWTPRPAAKLVDDCINVDEDCNPLRYDQIKGPAPTKAQIAVQSKIKPPAMLKVAGGGM